MFYQDLNVEAAFGLPGSCAQRLDMFLVCSWSELYHELLNKIKLREVVYFWLFIFN